MKTKQNMFPILMTNMELMPPEYKYFCLYLGWIGFIAFRSKKQ